MAGIRIIPLHIGIKRNGGGVIHQYFLGPFKFFFFFVSLRDKMSFKVSQNMSYERPVLVSHESLPPNSVAFHIVFSFRNT